MAWINRGNLLKVFLFLKHHSEKSSEPKVHFKKISFAINTQSSKRVEASVMKRKGLLSSFHRKS